MVKNKGSTNSHTLTIQPENTSNTGPGGNLASKMDMILGAIREYEGKTDTTIELMLDMQKRFKEKMEALRQENNAIKAWLNNQEDKHEKYENFEG